MPHRPNPPCGASDFRFSAHSRIAYPPWLKHYLQKGEYIKRTDDFQERRAHLANLTDDQLKTLGNAGGVVGINFERSFLKEGSEHATFDQIIQHLEYMKDKAGIDAIGFGSDFDGIEDNGELVNYGGFDHLIERMEGHFTYDEIDKITHLNALRVMKDVFGK